MSLPPLVAPKVPTVDQVKRRAARNLGLTEHQIQVAFIHWCRVQEAVWPELKLLFAVPNGGKRAIKTALRLKAEGQRPGVPDVMLPVPKKGHVGMALEFKRPGEQPTAVQRDYLKRLQSVGWLALVVDDAGDAIAAVTAYLR